MNITQNIIMIGKGISSSLISKIKGTITNKIKNVAIILKVNAIFGSNIAECTLGNQKNQKGSTLACKAGLACGMIELIINCIRILIPS